MSYLFKIRRPREKKSDEDNEAIQVDSTEIIVENDAATSVSPVDCGGESSPDSLDSSEPISPGNSPGEAATKRPSALRRILYDYWFEEKEKGSEEKYHPLTSNSEENLVSEMDVVLEEMERDGRLSEEKEAFKRKEKELDKKIRSLESDLKNCQLENEMLNIMVEDLVRLQETHQEQIDQVKKFYEDKILDINSSHETMIHELILSNQKQVEDFISSHEGLVEDLINSHEQQIREWKVAFETDVENIPELKDEKSIVGLPSKMWKDFLQLSDLSKGLVVIGIGILGSVIGLSSWRFVFWAWPKLVTFASTIEAADVLNVIGWLGVFIRSSGYQKFIKSWESGEPITKETIKDFGTDILGFAITHLGPSLLSQGKTSSKLQITAGNSKNNDMQF